MRSSYVFLLLVLIAGCGSSPAVIDGSSDSSLKDSLAKMKNSIPEHERVQFEDDVMVLGIAGDGLDLIEMAKLRQTPDGIKSRVRGNLHGKSLSEIRQRAAEIRESVKDNPTAKSLITPAP